MAKVEVYRAMGGMERLRAVAAPSPFTIEVRFVGGLTAAQKAAFKLAANRWSRVIIGDLPSVTIGEDVIDDVLILAEGAAIDGPGNILGQAGPTHLRPARAGKAAFLPARGMMTFDSADLAEMEKNGTLNDVITHEMGHVIGIGTVWMNKKLLKGGGGANPLFTGSAASAEYGTLKGTGPADVPVENTGGAGTRDSHWRESVFQTELMTGWAATAGNALSRMTIGSLADLGYEVNYEAADAYSLPDHLSMAEAALKVEPAGHDGLMLPLIPTVLPPESLQ